MPTLREVREARGVKQKAVAEHLGIARQTYGRYENHPEKMTLEQARAACNFLHCSIVDIFLPEDVK